MNVVRFTTTGSVYGGMVMTVAAGGNIEKNYINLDLSILQSLYIVSKSDYN